MPLLHHRWLDLSQTFAMAATVSDSTAGGGMHYVLRGAAVVCQRCRLYLYRIHLVRPHACPGALILDEEFALKPFRGITPATLPFKCRSRPSDHVALAALGLQEFVVQIVMAALVIVLAFFFMPGNDSSEIMLMRVRFMHDWCAQPPSFSVCQVEFSCSLSTQWHDCKVMLASTS
jgi:hypothetical protein